jgi:uncharacterized protein YbaR (Trm112 family)
MRFLCCPQCSATLIDATDDRMDCSGCSLAYPVRDGVPVLVIGEATSRPTPTDAEFERLIDEAVRAPFHGWDLSWLDACQTRTANRSADPTHQYDERATMLVALPGFGWDVGDSFRQAGLNIVQWTDYTATITYHDIGAVVYKLLHVPWGVVDFDLNRYRERLFRLHRRMLAEGGFRTRACTNLIEARKP